MLKPRQFGRYVLIDRISAGGMAEIFLARATGVAGFEKLLAIKRILPTVSEDPDFETMFIDEAKISAKLTHTNIAQVIEFGQAEGQYYIAMEYVPGKDLRAIQTHLEETDRTMDAAMALFVVSYLCQALDYAHRQKDSAGAPLNIIHRDVSPPNVLVSFDGAVKLIDFGIAKATSRATRTRAGKLKGKFAYMSPEQVQGAAVDHRSDVFSLGVLLHELLTNKRLFQGESQIAVMQAVRRAEVPPPSAINPEVPLEVDRIVLKALARERDQRYGWASELRADIERYFARSATPYDANRLAEWMRHEFAGDIEAERRLRERMRQIPTGELAPPGEAESPGTVDSSHSPGAAFALEDVGGPPDPAETVRRELDPSELVGDGDALASADEIPDTDRRALAEGRADGAGGHDTDRRSLDTDRRSFDTDRQQAIPQPAATGRPGVDLPELETTRQRLDPWTSAPDEDADGPAPAPAGTGPRHARPGGATPAPAPPRVIGPAEQKVRRELVNWPTAFSDAGVAGAPGQVPEPVPVEAPADGDLEEDEEDLPPTDLQPGLEAADLAGPTRIEPLPAALAIAPGPDRDKASVGGALEVDSDPSREVPADGADDGLVSVAGIDGVVQTNEIYLRRQGAAPLPVSGTQMVGAEPARMTSAQIILLAGGVTLLLAALVAVPLLIWGGGSASTSTAPVGAQVGTIVVRTAPAAGCSVSLDSRPKGLLNPGDSFRLARVSAGRHQIDLTCAGFKAYATSVEVQPAGLAIVEAPLQKE